MLLIWKAVESPLAVRPPLTVDVRATASCLDAWPTKSSFTLYPTTEPDAIVHVPARPAAATQLGDGAGSRVLIFIEPNHRRRRNNACDAG